MSEKSPGPEKDPKKESDWQRRKRLAEVFGDVLPSTTGDERDDRDPAADRRADDDLLADRPPHHDRER